MHGYQVAEPHVSQLVLDDDTEEGQLWRGHVLRAAHDRVRVSDTADVLHGAVLVIRAHHVVHFGEGVALAEVFLVVINCCFSDSED